MDFIIDIGMAVGPVLGYVHQYRLIKIKQEVGTFSIDICGILLFANILRLNFYIFKQYQLALFFQSIVMIIAQIFLVHICIKYPNKKVDVSLPDHPGKKSSLNQDGEKLQNFWRWKQFNTYFFFIAAFIFITFSVSIVFKQLQIQGYGVLVGLIALLSQSILIFPQILKNFFSKSTKGLSHVLVSLNLFGDIFKLVYFLIKTQPFQFILCGVIQVCLDSFVIIQIFYYKRLQSKNFQKQNKSLVIDGNNMGNYSDKPQTEQNMQDYQMKNIDQIIYPQINPNDYQKQQRDEKKIEQDRNEFFATNQKFNMNFIKQEQSPKQMLYQEYESDNSKEMEKQMSPYSSTNDFKLKKSQSQKQNNAYRQQTDLMQEIPKSEDNIPNQY